jgi:hypothetical protein
LLLLIMLGVLAASALPIAWNAALGFSHFLRSTCSEDFAARYS